MNGGLSIIAEAKTSPGDVRARTSRCLRLLSEMGKACFSRSGTAKGFQEWRLSSMTIVRFRRLNSSWLKNSRFRRGLSAWWMWDLSGFLNYLARFIKGLSCGVLAGAEKPRSSACMAIAAIRCREKFTARRSRTSWTFWEVSGGILCQRDVNNYKDDGYEINWSCK